MRVLLVVLDSVGIGALPDADQYGDAGSNTLGHTARTVGQLKLPVLEKLGLANILDVSGLKAQDEPLGCYGRMAEAAQGKDTITGHWELAGVIVSEPFRTYPRGFPAGLIEQFTRRIGRGILGNVAASGTEIIARLGKEHMETGKPIVYTSADSVFQIAAHEEVIPLAELYAICQTARELLHGEYKVARVIARPFIGVPGAFQRTANRRDFALEPEGQTVLDALAQNGREVVGIGKIHDIFSGRGIARSYKTRSNQHGIEILLDVTERGEGDLVFTNLVDFDMLYGHRNDAPGYARALEEADRGLGRVMAAMGNDDVLIVTADHGCDPTFPGTDHTREYVPLLVYGERIKRGVNLGTRQTFADVAAAVAEMLAVEYKCPGTSFWHEVKA
ncbi:MAG: phosphopentomutase [Firmicutes bacterium]|jgi:phosphopentomutase|nr:phosphopentomutase [Bacillota bacterium]HOB35454.1 phosphopentomutase [Bacillota bacterium]HPZ89751.1 phosphopentomutase [Bacillota bacterium]HQE01233.1 phosphopentomutase [Bacillota bacterium]